MKMMANVILLAGAAGLSACSQAGTLGDILGGVLNAPSQTVAGTIQGVDTRAQQIFLRTSDNQTVALSYDDRTDVVYQNQNYPVTALEAGDEVTARIVESNNGGYYTDRIDVRGSASSNDNNVQSVQGTVRQIDHTNGLFTVATSNQGVLTVAMPFNPRSQDLSRFRDLRAGDFVRLYGTYVTSTRVELRQFY